MMDNPDCIFCKIVRGEIPSTKVYEDDHVLAFLDIGPVVKGHVLVIPREHYDPLTATPAPVLHELIEAMQRVADGLMRGLKADGVNIHQANGAAAGQIVPHVHFHVIPRFADDGHHWNWAARKYSDMDEMAHVAATIRDAIPR